MIGGYRGIDGFNSSSPTIVEPDLDCSKSWFPICVSDPSSFSLYVSPSWFTDIPVLSSITTSPSSRCTGSPFSFSYSLCPGSGVPGSGVPGSGVPGSGVSGSGVPGSGVSGSGVPGSGVSGSGVSGSGVPGSGVGSSVGDPGFTSLSPELGFLPCSWS